MTERKGEKDPRRRATTPKDEKMKRPADKSHRLRGDELADDFDGQGRREQRRGKSPGREGV